MAQTTGAMSALDAKIEFSTDGLAWTDISGSSNKVTPSAQTRTTGTTTTFDGDKQIVTVGNKELMEIEVQAVYTEVVGEAYELARAAFETAASAYLRWSPAGGVVGDKQWTTEKGIITSFTYPPSDATSADPILASFTITAAAVIGSAVA